MSLQLPRLEQSATLIDENGLPTQTFQIWWNTFAANLEKAFNDLADNVAAIAAAQATADTAIANAAAAASDAAAAAAQALSAANAALAAQTSANTAQTTATTAQTSANNVKKTDKISASATVPSTVLSAFDAGTDASITIAAHTRIYGDTTTVTIGTPVTLTGLAYSTTYGIYYDDPSTSTTSPSYHATTILSSAMPNSADGRHFVGQVTTPASGGGTTTGGITPPGGGGPYP